MSVLCMLHTFLKCRGHYTSNIIVAAPMQCCNYYVLEVTRQPHVWEDLFPEMHVPILTCLVFATHYRKGIVCRGSDGYSEVGGGAHRALMSCLLMHV